MRARCILIYLMNIKFFLVKFIFLLVTDIDLLVIDIDLLVKFIFYSKISFMWNFMLFILFII